MARALQVLALLSAVLVVAVRCLSGFPFAATSAAGDRGSASSASEARSSSSNPLDRNALAIAEADDDADDGPDALLAPCAVRVVPVADGVTSAVGCGALVDQGALPSHARSLERPPRS